LLSFAFECVYTFEPEPRNFACLSRNMEDRENVFAARGVLGDKRGTVGLAVHSKGTGGHNIVGPGPLPTYRIDDLALEHCDAILLDVEGYEMHALRGALDTIKRCKPLLVVEENKKAHGKGFKRGDIEALLKPFGYAVVDRVGEDLVLAA
jgi:FkbM family methyltransferase